MFFVIAGFWLFGFGFGLVFCLFLGGGCVCGVVCFMFGFFFGCGLFFFLINVPITDILLQNLEFHFFFSFVTEHLRG